MDSPPNFQDSVPPTLPPPPPIITPPPAKPRKSWGWMITSIVLFLLLGLCVLVILAQSISHTLNFNRTFKTASSHEAGPKLDECVLKDNDSRYKKIAVISVDGIITSHTTGSSGYNMVDVIKAQLDRAADDDSVKAVILKIDSPGGEVMASDQINKAIVAFEAGTPAEHGQPEHPGKPVICSMGSLAASGGYYISAPCR
jgi:protease-4